MIWPCNRSEHCVALKSSRYLNSLTCLFQLDHLGVIITLPKVDQWLGLFALGQFGRNLDS